MTNRSNIYMVPPHKRHIAPCDICGATTQICFVDVSTNQPIGECCVGIAISVDRLLSNIPGICHPTSAAVEAGCIPNN